MSREFVFVTGNMDKVQWLERFLGKSVEHEKLDLQEIQSLDPIEVVREKAEAAYKILGKAVLIEDTALRFTAMGALPGPLIKFFYQELGNAGICHLLNAYEDRSATASVTYGYSEGNELQYFGAEITGRISMAPRGSNGHGWDPIFIPEGQSMTYAEMTNEQIDEHSVRNRAVEKLKEIL